MRVRPTSTRCRGRASSTHWRLILSSGRSESTSLRSSWASKQLRFFQPLQFHLELADLLEQFSFLGLALLLVLAFLASRQQLTATIQQLLLPLIHLNRVDDVIGDDLLDRLAATDRRVGDSGLEFGTMGAALAHGWEPPFQGRYPASEVNDGTCSEKQDQLTLHD